MSLRGKSLSIGPRERQEPIDAQGSAASRLGLGRLGFVRFVLARHRDYGRAFPMCSST
jgi:hypothetical protein